MQHVGVSRTVVREAMPRLKTMGHIESRQGSGALAKAMAEPTLERTTASGGDGVAEDVAFYEDTAAAANNPFQLATQPYRRQFLFDSTRVTRANEATRSVFRSKCAMNMWPLRKPLRQVMSVWRSDPCCDAGCSGP
jgi:GntR family transcriptional repressor for pyruvate dehydrogenase complex